MLGRFTSLGEPQVVMLDNIVPLMERWIKLQNADGDFNAHFKIEGWSRMTGLDLLAHRAELNTRRITGYLRREFRFMPLSHADKLLLAMGMSDLLGSDEIPIIKNPNWSYTQYRRFMESVTATE